MTTQMRDADMPLLDRIDAAIKRVTSGQGQMRVPVEATDPDMVLFACKLEIERLRAGNAGMTETIEWTPVAEKQPAFGKTVLVCINEDPDATDVGWFDGEHWIGFEDGTFAPGEVTHWAEKPKGPGA